MKKYATFITLTLMVILGFASIIPDQEQQRDIYVLVKYKSLAGKHDEAVAGLKTLISEVKKEPHYVNISMMTDPSDPTNILLYEQWKDEAYYKGDHMKTPHLQQFINSSRSFLAGPPEISFWKSVE